MGRLGRRDKDLFGDRPTVLPPGIIVPYGGTAAPSGWLLCDGTAVSRTDYADLFAVLGTAYGAGNGTTTFNLPDLQGRVSVGKAAAGTFATLGGTGGAETVTLTAAQSGLPAHTHTATSSSGTGGSHSHSGSTGSDAGHTHSASTSVSSHYHDVPNVAYSATQRTDLGGGGSKSALDAIFVGTRSSNYTTPTATTSVTTGGSHSHSVSVGSGGDHSHSVTTTVAANATAAASAAHDNVQPYVVVNHIVKT